MQTRDTDMRGIWLCTDASKPQKTSVVNVHGFVWEDQTEVCGQGRGRVVVVVRTAELCMCLSRSHKMMQLITGQSPRELDSWATAPAPTYPDGKSHKDMEK